MNVKNNFFLIIFCSCIASLGTYPFAKNFAYFFYSTGWQLVITQIIFIATAILTNITLGSYSLYQSTKSIRKIPFWRSFSIGILSLAASSAIGFICFIGYSNQLPLSLNIILSTIVGLVNAGIGFNALNALFEDLTDSNSSFKKQGLLKFMFISLCMISGFVATITFYLASTNGLNMLFKQSRNLSHLNPLIIYGLAVLIWLPNAALFLNGVKKTMTLFYDYLNKKTFNLTLNTWIILLIALPSGSAYSQMTLELLNPSNFIPELFKMIMYKFDKIIYPIMIFAFISSSLVNGYALNNLINEFNKIHQKKK